MHYLIVKYEPCLIHFLITKILVLSNQKRGNLFLLWGMHKGNNKKNFFMKPLAIEESLCVIKEYKLFFSFFQKNLPPPFQKKKILKYFFSKKGHVF